MTVVLIKCVSEGYRGQIGAYLLSGSRFDRGNVLGKPRRIETVTSRRPQIHVHCRGVRPANLRSLCKHGGYTRLPSRWELLNARSARKNKDLIREHIVDHNTDILFLTETWLPHLDIGLLAQHDPRLKERQTSKTPPKEEDWQSSIGVTLRCTRLVTVQSTSPLNILMSKSSRHAARSEHWCCTAHPTLHHPPSLLISQRYWLMLDTSRDH